MGTQPVVHQSTSSSCLTSGRFPVIDPPDLQAVGQGQAQAGSRSRNHRHWKQVGFFPGEGVGFPTQLDAGPSRANSRYSGDPVPRSKPSASGPRPASRQPVPARRIVEHAFREAKSELAMADYQVRRWDAWHRHMALVMVAMLFLLKERLALQAEAPMLSLADLVMAINQLLPRPEPTPNRIASIIHERHRRRQDALAACLRRESEI